jgi:hypothetical protein
MTIAETIYNQLGGRKFKFITGAKGIEGHDTGLSFMIGRNATKTNHVIINLNAATDTYDITFERVTHKRKPSYQMKRTVLVKKEGVYCDMLRDIFTDVTGLATSL